MSRWDQVKLSSWDWTMRMFLEADLDLSAYLGTIKSAHMIKNWMTADDFTSLRLILPESCTHINCTEALNNCILTATDTEVIRPVMKSNQLREWSVECAVFDMEDIPESDGGLPGRRLTEGDRDRGVTDGQPAVTQGLAVKTPVVLSYDTTSTKPDLSEKTEYCEHLKNENVTAFYRECCLNNHASDSHCALSTLLNAYEEQHKVASPVKPNMVDNPFAESIPDEDEEEDIGRLAKDLDLEEDFEEHHNKTTESQSQYPDQEVLETISSWKSRYFTVLGFFLVFLAIFLVVIVALIYKIRKSKAASAAPGSPGAGLSVSRHERSRRGYSSVAEEEAEDKDALTPATQQAQAFNY